MDPFHIEHMLGPPTHYLLSLPPPQRQKLVIDDTQRLVASLRSDNEHLTLALAAMMRGREEDVDRLIAEVKSRFERHRAMLMEDNRVLAATHREDVEKIKV